jgi:hypothetical protein
MRRLTWFKFSDYSMSMYFAFLCSIVKRISLAIEVYVSYFQRTYFPFIDTDFVSIVRPISMPGKRK